MSSLFSAEQKDSEMKVLLHISGEKKINPIWGPERDSRSSNTIVSILQIKQIQMSKKMICSFPYIYPTTKPAMLFFGGQVSGTLPL